MNYNCYSCEYWVGQIWCGNGKSEALAIAQRTYPDADITSVERAVE